MTASFVNAYQSDIRAQFRLQKQVAERILARVDDRAFFTRLPTQRDGHTNSLAMLVKHLAGGLRSAWTDFLTTDADKPERQREREFRHEEGERREHLMQGWEAGWQALFATLETLQPADFERTVTKRGQPLSVIEAIHSSLLHATHHIGQMDLLATLLQGEADTTQRPKP